MIKLLRSTCFLLYMNVVAAATAKFRCKNKASRLGEFQSKLLSCVISILKAHHASILYDNISNSGLLVAHTHKLLWVVRKLTRIHYHQSCLSHEVGGKGWFVKLKKVQVSFVVLDGCIYYRAVLLKWELEFCSSLTARQILKCFSHQLGFFIWLWVCYYNFTKFHNL